MTVEQLDALMLTEEDEHLEFKEAKGTYNFVDLRDYCAALSNEGGGKLILGVSNRRPRKIVGTRAFQNLQATKADLLRDLGIRVEAAELRQDDHRVLVFDVPRHPLGMVVYSGPKLLMRGGEGLVRMTQDVQRRILNEAVQDFSALNCPDATLESLDPAAIESLRVRWQKKSGRTDLAGMTTKQLLEAAELSSDAGVRACPSLS
ncbi:MAG: ATP-binding protein [candidate division WOR-3 bacterium]|nr:ATP-binding protein [candidate division WOR-3 bacterium]